LKTENFVFLILIQNKYLFRKRFTASKTQVFKLFTLRTSQRTVLCFKGQLFNTVKEKTCL